MTSSIFQNHFRGDRCRIEQGIFFGNDQALLVECVEQPDGSLALQVTGKTDAQALQAAAPDNWTEIHASALYPTDELLVMAGPGQWEGEGFIALTDLADGSLRWLIHLRNSEPFISVEVVDGVIHAVSSEYPNEHHWRVPLDQPQALVGRKAI